jgi:hypothetical protein
MNYYSKSKKLFPIIFLMIFFYSCAPKVQIVPEVTGQLTADEIYTFSADIPVFKLLEHDSNFVMVNGRGTISKVSIATGELKFIYQMKFAIHPDIYRHDDVLVMRDRSGQNIVMFDINEMKVLRSIEEDTEGRCIGADKRAAVLSTGNKLIVLPSTSKKKKMEIEIGSAQVFATRVESNGIYVPTADHLIRIDTERWNVQKTAFPIPCNSGILLDKGFIYYGSPNRQLLKFDPVRNKIIWKLTLTKNLSEAPLNMANHIVCTPEDQNIYFVSPNGTLDWWQKLGSTRLLPPVSMENNVAVFLFPKESPEVRYFNLKDRETHSYQLKDLIQGDPIFYGKALYILKGKKEGQQKKTAGIVKIANRFEVDIKTEPKRLLSTGKSIKFILKPVNLIEPALEVKILNSKKESIFNKEIIDAEKGQFNWIPESKGNYEVTVDAKTEDGQVVKSSQAFTVLDTDTLLLDHYLKLQQACNADIFMRKKKDKKNAKNH